MMLTQKSFYAADVLQRRAQLTPNRLAIRDATTAPPIGVVELSDEDIAELKHDDDEIDGWFK